MIDYNKLNDFEWLFKDYVRNGNLEGIKRILPYTELSAIKNKCFVDACWFGKLEMAQLIYATNKPNIKYFFSSREYNTYGDALKIACEYGRIDIVKWLLSLNERVDITCEDYFDAFKHACYNGNLEIAKILYDEDDNLDINYISHDEHIFECVCRSGNLKIAKWLYSFGDKLNIDFKEAFENASRSGNIEILKWVYSLNNNYDIHDISYTIFHDGCLYGNLDIVKWIYSLDNKFNIREHDDELFKKFADCDSEILTNFGCNQIETLEYLVTLCNDYEIEIEDYEVKSWNIKKQ
jgi:ankyrin repeat protein